jgi:hypothetical protein
MHSLCDELNPSEYLDSVGLRVEVIKNVGGVLLLNNPDPNFPYNVNKMCAALANTSNGLSSMDKLAGEVRNILAIRKQECLDFKEKILKKLQSEEWETPGTKSGERQTLFLRCTTALNSRTLDALGLGNEGKIVTNHTLEFCKRLFK